MAVCDPVGGMHSLFRGTLVEHVFADRPPPGFDAPVDEPAMREHLSEMIARHAPELAAVIVEPVVQGAGGMHFYSPSGGPAAAELCDRHTAVAGPRRDRDRVWADAARSSPPTTPRCDRT